LLSQLDVSGLLGNEVATKRKIIKQLGVDDGLHEVGVQVLDKTLDGLPFHLHL
jgi:hypothetical protein